MEQALICSVKQMRVFDSSWNLPISISYGFKAQLAGKNTA